MHDDLYRAALKRELAGYIADGNTARADQVRAELARLDDADADQTRVELAAPDVIETAVDRAPEQRAPRRGRRV
jgi:hypothetical protein